MLAGGSMNYVVWAFLLYCSVRFILFSLSEPSIGQSSDISDSTPTQTPVDLEAEELETYAEEFVALADFEDLDTLADELFSYSDLEDELQQENRKGESLPSLTDDDMDMTA
jgi:hypothetical protein